MLKLKLQYSGHLIQRADSLEKSLTLGKIEGRRPLPSFGLKDSWWFCFFLTHVLYRERHIFQLPLITYVACVRIIIVIRAKMC